MVCDISILLNKRVSAFKIPNKFLDGIGNIAGNVAEGDQVQVEEAFMYILIYLKHNSTIIMQLKK